MSRTVSWLPVLVMALASPALAGPVTLDAFTDPFAPNICMHNSHAPVIWNAYPGFDICDGTACPPDPVATCGPYEDPSGAFQTGLPGVLGGAIRAGVVDCGAGGIIARVRTDLNRFEVSATGGGRWQGAGMSYGYLAGSWGYDMNLDWTALGVTQLAMDCGGDMSPTLPLWCNVTMYTHLLHGYGIVALELMVTQPGMLVFPFSQFSEFNGSAGFSITDVDIVEVTLGACPSNTQCSAPDVARTSWIGPIRGESGVVATHAGSWGRLKTLYR